MYKYDVNSKYKKRFTFIFTIHLLLKVYTDLLESMWEGVEEWDSDENLECEDNEGEEYE